MMFNRAAPTAGKKPPIKPISREKPRELAMIDGAGHYPHAEVPEEAGARIIGFLNGLQLDGRTRGSSLRGHEAAYAG